MAPRQNTLYFASLLSTEFGEQSTTKIETLVSGVLLDD